MCRLVFVLMKMMKFMMKWVVMMGLPSQPPGRDVRDVLPTAFAIVSCTFSCTFFVSLLTLVILDASMGKHFVVGVSAVASHTRSSCTKLARLHFTRPACQALSGDHTVVSWPLVCVHGNPIAHVQLPELVATGGCVAMACSHMCSQRGICF